MIFALAALAALIVCMNVAMLVVSARRIRDERNDGLFL